MKRKFTFLMAAFMLLAFLAVPLGMRGQSTAGFTLSGMPSGASATSTSGTITGSSNESWSWNATFSGDATSSAQNSSWQIGSSKKPCTQAVFSTSGISGTITNISVSCGTKNAAGTVNCTVGGNDFGTQGQSTGTGNDPANYGTTPSFSGSASGEIVITINNTQTYISIKSITVTFTSGSTPVDPSITFNNGSVYVGQTLDLSTLFSSNSTGAVTYSITAGDSYASLVGSILTGVAAGNVTVKAEQAEVAGTYNAGEATATITVNAARTLSSITITTPPTKITYVEGETFDATGMVVTATYSDSSTDDVTALCTWTPDGALTTSDDEITVSYTENAVTKTATQSITVDPYVQPTIIEANLNNSLFGTSYNGSASISDANPISGTQDNVTITYGGSGNHYVNNTSIRFYSGNTLTFEAPSGYEIKQIEFTPVSGGTWTTTISANSGSYTNDTKTWVGTATSVIFTGSGGSGIRCDMESATITIGLPVTRYDITYATGLANGDFATSGNPTDAAADENVTVTTVPAAGYHLATMTYNDGTTTHDATVSGNTGSFTMPAADVTVSATFAESVAAFTDGVYSETLTTQASFDTWKSYSVTGDQEWEFAGSSYGAKMTGYVNSTNNENEDWLISPKMQIANGKLDISFDCVGRFGDDGMATIWYSTNYTGSGDPTSASWTAITPDPAIPYAASNWNFQTITGSIEATGNVYFAIKYVSTNTNAGTLEVKNFTAKQYYTITLSATNGGIMSDPEDLAVVGANVELVALPNSGYHFVSWAVTPSSVTIENDEFTMPAENVSINTVYELDNTYTITFNENGQTIEDDFTSGPIGSNLPTTPFGAIPANLTFFGWSTSPIDTYTETAPELVNADYNISSNATFYAVYKYDYSYTEGGSPATWRKVTDASTLAVGDQLVIASDAQGKVAGEIANEVMGEVAATFDNSVMASLPSGAVVLTLGGTSGAWTLANSSDQLLGATAVKKLAWGSGTTTWNIVIDDNGEASIYNGTSSYGRFLHNVNNTRFTTYTSLTNASMLLPKLYRLEGGTTPVSGSYYLTSVTERGTNASISTATTWDGNNTINAEIEIDGATLTVGGLLINPDVDNIFIENGGQLIAKGKGVKATVWKDIDGYSGDGGWNLIASPLAENTTPESGNGFLVGDYDLYYHDEATSYWMNYENSAFNIQPNKGYLYATDEATGTILEFAGAINPSNENITISGLTNTSAVGVAAGYNLVGNPFTCTAYLSDGRDFYHMNSAGNDIVVKTNNAINVCEGVFVQCAANETVTFTTTDPSVTSTGNNNGMVNISVAQMVNTRDAQPSTDIARIRINNGENMTKFVFNENNSHVYIPQDGNDYAVVRSEAHGEMPVNFKAAENGTYTIDVEAENLEVNYLHLIDNLTGMDVDLLATPSYTFEARKSDIASRFRLVFDANTGNDETNDNFAFINNGELIVNGNGTVQVIDILGRQMFSHEVNSSFRIQNSEFGPGVYVLRLVNGNDVKTQKIVIK